MAEPTLQQVDSDIASLIKDEERRQHEKIRLIPSENYASKAVLEATVEANTFIADYVAGLEGYTYLEGEAAQ